jgi:hypothetical protein
MDARWIVGLFALAALLAVTPARAADPPPHLAIRLAYDHGPGIDGCPDENGFRYALMAQFGYDPTEPPLIADFEPPPLLRVTLSRQGTQNRAEASLVKASGAVLWGGEYQDRIDCPTLVRNIVLVIRIGIGVDAPFSAPTTTPAPPLPPRPVLPPVVVVEAPPKPPPSTWPKVRAGLGTGIAFGVAPAAAVGFSLAFGLRWPVVSLSVEGRGDLPAASDALGIRTSMLSATLAPCVHVWEYGAACGLLTVGTLRSALLQDTTDTTHTSSAYMAAGVRLGLEVPFAGRWVARLSGDLVAAVVPTIVRVGLPKIERWRSATVAGGPGIGLLVNFDGP